MFTVAIHDWREGVALYACKEVQEIPNNETMLDDDPAVGQSPCLQLVMHDNEVVSHEGFMSAYIMNSNGKTVRSVHGSGRIEAVASHKVSG